MPDYTTREMMEAYDQTPPVRSFFQKTFFPGNQTHVSEKVEFDVRKGKRIMAPFVSPRKGGKVITRQGFRTNEFTTTMSTNVGSERISIPRKPQKREKMSFWQKI